MKKKDLLIWSLAPALVLGTAAPVMAASQAATPASKAQLKAELQAELQQLQELEAQEQQMTEKLGSMHKRVSKVEKVQKDPKLHFSGYSRLRWDDSKFESAKGTNRKEFFTNVYTDFHVDGPWSVKTELELHDTISENGVGNPVWNSSRSRDEYDDGARALQAYIDGHVGQLGLKLGKFSIVSPYSLTLDEKVNGWQAYWEKPTPWWRPLRLALTSANMEGHQRTFAPQGDGYWGQYYDADGNMKINADDWERKYRLLSFMGTVPLNNDMDVVFHYGRAKDQGGYKVQTGSVGFSTKFNRDLRLTAAYAKSNAKIADQSHFIQLQYKDCWYDATGSYDFYIKKQLYRIHSGLNKLFYDDLEYPDGTFSELADGNARTYEFNGLRIGFDFCPVHYSKVMMYYNFGDMSRYLDYHNRNAGQDRKHYSFFRTEWQFLF
jgi:hypothetical protein